MGSGVARGWAHIGALRVLEKEGLCPEVIVGTSIGALAGGSFAAGKLNALEEFARSMTTRRLLRLLDIRLGGSGLIRGKKLEALLESHLQGVCVEDLPSRFIAVTTELGTGHEIWLQKGNLAKALRASYALPGIFQPIRHQGRWLIDGALVNPVPVSVCRAFGARLVIAVNLNRDLYGKTGARSAYQNIMENHETPDLESALLKRPRALIRQIFGMGSGPGLTAVMMASLNIVQDRLARSRLAGDPPDIQISPRCGHIGLLEFDRAEEAIALGEEATRHMLPTIKEAMDFLTYRIAE